MSDRFEQQLKQGLKESTQKSLAGWEFSPAMRQAVLTRIAEEERAPEPIREPIKASPARVRRVIPQPLVWAVAAAAAFALVLNMDWSNRSTKSDQAPMSAASKPEAEAKKEMAAAESASPQIAASKAANDQGTAEATGGVAAFAEPAGAPHMILAVPDAGPKREVPAAAQPPGIGIMSTVPVESMLDLSPLPGGESAVLTSSSLRLLDATGGTVWEQRLSEPPLLMSAAGAKIAVAGTESVQLFSQTGQPEGSLKPAGPVFGLQASADGRLAVIAGDQVQVFNGTKLQFQSGPLSNASVAFAPDGTLAVTGQEGANRSISLFGRDGSRLAYAGLPAEGSGLAFAEQGQVVIAGSQAFHRNGQPLWQAGLVPNGAVALGADGPVLLWDLHQLMLLRPQDGSPVWTAEIPGAEIVTAVASQSGDQVAVLAVAPDGPVVWVLTQGGTERMAQRLTTLPADLAIEGDQLILLTANGLDRVPMQP